MPKTKEQIILKKKKKNVKIFPIYKTISWDLLFYYPIIFLFLTQIKGFSASQVLFSDCMYTLFNMFWQLPMTWVVSRIGKKNCLVIGNVLYALSILAIIFVNQYYELILIQFMYAMGYAIKGICEPNILYDSLPKGKKRGSVFSLIDGKSSSYFYLFDAISSVMAGYTFIINGYIPMILCFICCIASIVISFKFRNVPINEKQLEPVKLKDYVKQIRGSLKLMVTSKRLKSLIIFNAIFMGLTSGIINLRSSMLSDIKVPSEYFGVIFAILQFAAALTSRNTDKIQEIFKNKTLTYLALPVTISCILVGIAGIVPISKFSLILIILLYLIQYMIKGPFQALMIRYLNNFTTAEIRIKITALKNLFAYLFTAIVSLTCSFLLSITSTAVTFIVIGCLTTLFATLMLDYMRDKVGLKPEQYDKTDNFTLKKKKKKNISSFYEIAKFFVKWDLFEEILQI